MSDDEFSYSTTVTKVPLLTPSTYHLWSRELEYYLMQLGLWRIVSGAAQRPTPLLVTVKAESKDEASPSPPLYRDEKERKAVEAWEEKDEKAKATIIFAIRKDLRDVVTTEMTSKELWDAIKKKFGKQSLTDAEHTFNTMLSARYTDGESMTAHINLFRDSNLRLKGTEFHQGNAALVFFLLKSLPSTWEPVKMTIRTNSINTTRVRLGLLYTEGASRFHEARIWYLYQSHRTGRHWTDSWETTADTLPTEAEDLSLHLPRAKQISLHRGLSHNQRSTGQHGQQTAHQRQTDHRQPRHLP
jgi:hypothetical protein